VWWLAEDDVHRRAFVKIAGLGMQFHINPEFTGQFPPVPWLTLEKSYEHKLFPRGRYTKLSIQKYNKMHIHPFFHIAGQF